MFIVICDYPYLEQLHLLYKQIRFIITMGILENTVECMFINNSLKKYNEF
jgi:hypothetical protein